VRSLNRSRIDGQILLKVRNGPVIGGPGYCFCISAMVTNKADYPMIDAENTPIVNRVSEETLMM
jgi:hypothetical protein